MAALLSTNIKRFAAAPTGIHLFHFSSPGLQSHGMNLMQIVQQIHPILSVAGRQPVKIRTVRQLAAFMAVIEAFTRQTANQFAFIPPTVDTQVAAAVAAQLSGLTLKTIRQLLPPGNTVPFGPVY